jgi:hypothetical protein
MTGSGIRWVDVEAEARRDQRVSSDTILVGAAVPGDRTMDDGRVALMNLFRCEASALGLEGREVFDEDVCSIEDLLE